MALTQITTWVPGQVLRAADLNAEFANVLNNPISLISPTSGPINFNLQGHSNLLPAALSASSGLVGQVLTITSSSSPPAWQSAAAVVFTSLSRGQLLVGTSSGGVTTVSIGSSGQVLSVTSSNSLPVWAVSPTSTGAGTVRSVVITVSSGDLTLLAGSAAAAVAPNLNLTPVTTAATLLMGITGQFISSGGVQISSGILFSFLLDGVVSGTWFLPGVSTGVDWRGPVLGSLLTSVVSTAAHTVNVSAQPSASGPLTILRTTDPFLKLWAHEIATSG